MPVYTGPVPAVPTTTSTDAQWQNWWAYQGVLRDLRYEDERAAAVARQAVLEKQHAERQSVLDKQHAERMARDDACAAANKALAESQAKLAAAQQAAAVALVQPQHSAEQTDAQIMEALLPGLISGGMAPDQAVVAAKQAVRVYRFLNRSTP